MFNPEALEAAKRFLFGPQPESMPSTTDPAKITRSNDPLDRSLGLGGSIRDKVRFLGAAQLPHNPNLRLVKRQPARP